MDSVTSARVANIEAALDTPFGHEMYGNKLFVLRRAFLGSPSVATLKELSINRMYRGYGNVISAVRDWVDPPPCGVRPRGELADAVYRKIMEHPEAVRMLTEAVRHHPSLVSVRTSSVLDRMKAMAGVDFGFGTADDDVPDLHRALGTLGKLSGGRPPKYKAALLSQGASDASALAKVVMPNLKKRELSDMDLAAFEMALIRSAHPEPPSIEVAVHPAWLPYSSHNFQDLFDSFLATYGAATHVASEDPMEFRARGPRVYVRAVSIPPAQEAGDDASLDVPSCIVEYVPKDNRVVIVDRSDRRDEWAVIHSNGIFVANSQHAVRAATCIRLCLRMMRGFDEFFGQLHVRCVARYCWMCDTEMTSPVSLERGMGPTCHKIFRRLGARTSRDMSNAPTPFLLRGTDVPLTVREMIAMPRAHSEPVEWLAGILRTTPVMRDLPEFFGSDPAPLKVLLARLFDLTPDALEIAARDAWQTVTAHADGQGCLWIPILMEDPSLSRLTPALRVLDHIASYDLRGRIGSMLRIVANHMSM